MQDTSANAIQTPSRSATLPLHRISEAQFATWRDARPASVRQWLESTAFVPDRGRWVTLPDVAGQPQGVLAGLGKDPLDSQAFFWLGAALSDRLPAGNYRLAEPMPSDELFVLGWAQGGYRFLRYKSRSNLPRRPHLEPPATLDLRYVQAATRACTLARDLINTPANDMGPHELGSAALAVAQESGGKAVIFEGEALTAQFPLVAAVGRGSPRAPRLIDLHFPRPGAPRITLVGKGVCFDTGGLDIKAAAGMLLMKKDMGGAACALATAQLVQELGLPIDLRVLVPAVENSVDGHAFRPGDVWPSRKGLSVEIGNTDAEGRLVLADALAFACESNPDLIIDFATLTGAARIALGAELPAAYGGDSTLLGELAAQGAHLADPVWPMPLWDGYDDELGSRIADLNNAPASALGGSITAALFLRRFITDPARWLHLDLYGWNGKDRPGRPAGAEAQCVRAIAGLLQQRYA